MILRALVILLLWVSVASGQTFTPSYPTVTSDDVVQGQRVTHFEFPSGSFAITQTSTGHVTVDLSGDVTLLGPLIGDVATDFAPTTLLTNITVDATAATALLVGDNLYGGSGSGDDLTMTSTSHATLGDIIPNGPVLLWTSHPDFTAGTTETRQLIRFSDSYTTTPNNGITHIVRGLELSPTITSAIGGTGLTNITGIDFNPTVTMQSNFQTIGVHGRGTYTNSGAPGFGSWILFYAQPTLTSTTSSIGPYGPVVFQSAPTVQYDLGSGSATTASIIEYNAGGTVRNVLAGGTFTVTDWTQYDTFANTLTETAGTLSVGTRRVLRARDVAFTNSPALDLNIGVDVAAFANGTARHQIRLGEMTLAGTPTTGFGALSLESGAPSHLTFTNESGHQWRNGHTSISTMMTGLPTNTTPVYYVMGTSGASGTEAANDRPSPGAITVFGMSCGVEPDAGTASDALRFDLRSNGADVTGINCTITTTATDCQVRVEAGTAVPAGAMIDIEVTGTSTPSATEGTCTVYFWQTPW